VTLVPDDFEIPARFEAPWFVLEPLGPGHNERDHAAWTSSIDHIRRTPGFAGRSWPQAMALEENLADLESHRAEFEARTAFAYTVLDPETDDVIGCVYVNPDPGRAGGATLRSWVRVTHAELDETLRADVATWLSRDWPFTSVSGAGIDSPES
jgi:hypothetical protein